MALDNYLSALRSCKSGIKVTELATRLGVSRMAANKAVRKLISQGLAKKDGPLVHALADKRPRLPDAPPATVNDWTSLACESCQQRLFAEGELPDDPEERMTWSLPRKQRKARANLRVARRARVNAQNARTIVTLGVIHWYWSVKGRAPTLAEIARSVLRPGETVRHGKSKTEDKQYERWDDQLHARRYGKALVPISRTAALRYCHTLEKEWRLITAGRKPKKKLGGCLCCGGKL